MASFTMTDKTYSSVIESSVLGIKFKDGVILAADMFGSYGSLTRFRNISRLTAVNSNTAMAFSGDYADYQLLNDVLQQKIIYDECLDDGHGFTPKSLFAWLTRVMYNRRSKFNPLWNSLAVGGFYKGESFLGYVDKLGSAYESPTVATGLGTYIALPIMRHALEEKPSMNESETKEIIYRCMRALFYRDATAFNKYKVAVISKKGVKIERPVTLSTSWSLEHNTEDKPGCWICAWVGQTHVTSYKEIVNATKGWSNTRDLEGILTVAMGGGQYKGEQYKDKKKDELCKAIMEKRYPKANERRYYWPLVSKSSHPKVSSDAANREPATAHVPGSNVKYGNVQSDKKGEDAEENVFRLFYTMLEKEKIPSFVVHGFKWDENSYPQELDKFCNKYKFDIKRWKAAKTGGEFDILISVPGICLLSIEVKGTCAKSCGQTCVIVEAFRQCKKALTFISILNYDLFHDKNIPFIRAVAVPNCSRADLSREPICDNCSKHIITKDELEHSEGVYKWFSAVTGYTKSNQMTLNSKDDLHEKIIGRLFRLISLRLKKKKSQQMTTSEEIERYGTVENIRDRFIQFNKEQADVIMGNHELLWITGEPGSGKTLLLWKKIEDLLEGHDGVGNGTETFKVIAFPGNNNEKLFEKYEQQLPHSLYLATQKFWRPSPGPTDSTNTCNVLPKFINDSQKTYKGKVLHIFIDEFTFLLKGTDWTEFKKDWKKLDLKNLGFVWVVQNPLSTDHNEIREQMPVDLGEHSPGFKKVHLEYVMRMTGRNVQFVSHVLDRPTLISGHGVEGQIPVLYRMSCVCTQSTGSVNCKICIHKRQALLIVQIIKKLCCEGTETDRVSISDIVILMKDDHKFVVGKLLSEYCSKFPDRQYNAITFTDSSAFRGCEEKIVIVNLLEPALDVKNLMEGLTICVDRLIVMDTGRSYEELAPNDKTELSQEDTRSLQEKFLRNYENERIKEMISKYENVEHKISDAVNKGLVLLKEIKLTDFSKEEQEVI